MILIQLSNEVIVIYKKICYNYIIKQTILYVKEVNMKNKNLYLRYIPMSFAAAFIIFFAVKNALYPPEGQQVELWYLIFKTMPTIITLFVQIMLISANRYAFLVGGINSALYSIVYFIEGITFSAISALVISCFIQLYSFVTWGKNSKSTGKVALRFLNAKYRILTFAAALGIWVTCYFWLSKYMVLRVPLLDTITFSLGIICTVLSARRYIDSQYINLVSCLLGLLMWIMITVQNPTNINYVIIQIYNVYCVGQAAVNWTLIYVRDKKEGEKNV